MTYIFNNKLHWFSIPINITSINAEVFLFQKSTGVNVLDANQVKSLGNLVVGLSNEALSKLSKDAFLSEVHRIASKPGMTKDKLRVLIDLGRKYFGKRFVWLLAVLYVSVIFL